MSELSQCDKTFGNKLNCQGSQQVMLEILVEVEALDIDKFASERPRLNELQGKLKRWRVQD